MENSLRCIADGRAREKPFCGEPQFQARALSVAPLRTPLRSSTTVPRRTRVCDPVRMDGRAFVAPPRLRRGLLCASRQIALTPAKRRVPRTRHLGSSDYSVIHCDASRNDESINRASRGQSGCPTKNSTRTRAPQSRDPVRKPPTRTLTRDRAARPRLRVRVVTCVHHNILEPRGVRASSDLDGSPSPRPPPSLRVSSLTPKTRGCPLPRSLAGPLRAGALARALRGHVDGVVGSNRGSGSANGGLFLLGPVGDVGGGGVCLVLAVG